jgi:PKD domain/Secretion system C-terminal sorting domain
MEYWCPYLGANNILYGYSNASLLPVALPLPGGQTVKAVGPTFNQVVVVTNTGNVYQDQYYNRDPTIWTQISTDVNGNPLNDAVNVWGYEDTYIILRADGSLWIAGIDEVQMLTTSTSVILPTKISPAGIKFTSAAISNYGMLAICTDGSVYQWKLGSGTNPAHITFSGGTGKALMVANGNGNQWACASFAIVQQTPGSNYGHPYVWGNNSALWGSAAAQSFTTPTDLYAQLGLKSNVAVIACGVQTMHLIDSLGNMYGAGDNVQGEVGNGVEFVNRYTYSGWPNYGWDFQIGEDPAVFTQIGAGIKWANCYTNSFFTFYWYAMDVNGNQYSWGRGKSYVLGAGAWGGYAWNPADPNLFDQSSPRLVTPMTTPLVIYNVTLPVRGAGPNQTISTNSATISCTGQPLWEVNSTNINDTLCCHYASFQWVQESGPTGATIVSPTSKTTIVNGLTNGTYRFRVLTTDVHNGMDTASVQVICNLKGIPPTVSAGSNQTITPPTSSVSLSGSASANDGSNISSYVWTQVSGPSTAAIGSPSLASTSVSGLAPGTYIFQLSATDGLGVTGSATVQVTVNAGPGSPSANAGTAQTITLPANSVTLTGSGSESSGTIVSYSWTQLSGPSTATIASSNQTSTQVTGLVQGTYRFQLTVTDALGITASATVQVIVNPSVSVPGPPAANAGTTQTITLPTSSVTLSGSGSETNGTIVTYAWTQLSGPNTAAINVPGSAVTAISGLIQGSYRFQLMVTDALGVTASATVQVIVNAAPVVPGAPSANAGSNQTITLPTNNVTLSGSGSETNGIIVTYAWTQVNGPSTATINVPGSAVTAVDGLVQGTYRFQLMVTDGLGVTASATMQVTVNAAPVVPGPPSANAGPDQTITLPTNNVTLSGSGSETNGTIVTYAWTQVSGPSTATIGVPGSAVTAVTGLVQGAYVFRLTVTDNSGVTANDAMLVTVKPAVAVPGTPSADAGSNQTITLPTNSVTLTGSGTETSGTIASYAWTQITGPNTATISSAGNAVTGVSGLVQGTYRFQLTVTDALGVTASATVQVTVNAAPVVPGPPSANAGPDQTITLPTNSVTLSGSGSETNGTIVTYAWTQVSGPGSATINVPGSALTAVSGLVQGTYQFKLTVTDNSGVTASDVMFVTVKAAPVVPGPPSANAGPDQTITLPTNSVTASGSGSESNGTIVTYAWTQVSGPGTAVIANAGSAVTGISGLVAGTYEFKLTVTDALGVTASDVFFVTVRSAAAIPGPPSANAGSDQTITLPTNSVTLSGSGSETNGVIVTYAWTQLSGPGTATINVPGSAVTAVGGLIQGEYQFKLTVSDALGVTASDYVYVKVNPEPVVLGPLSADAGSDQTITLPVNNVALSGSGSESNGTIVAYTWKQSSGPATAEIYSMSTSSTGVGGMDVPGTYTFQLIVTDRVGNTATASVVVTVKSHIPPVANAGPNTTTSKTSGLQLNGTGSYDVDGTIVSYSWVQLSGAGGVTITNENSATPTVDGLQPGVYVFQLTVTDDAGASATATVTITVTSNGSSSDTTAANAPVAIAGTDTTVYYPNGDTAILNGSASYAPGSSIASYSWTEVSGPSEMSVTNSSSSVGIVANMAPGVYVFQLVVSNTAGDTASATVKVQVLDNQRVSDVVTLYPNPVQVGQQLTVTGSNGYSGQVNLLVVDMGGRVVRTMAMEKQAPTFVQTINVSGLARGVYVLRMEFGTGQKPIALKFVVQ